MGSPADDAANRLWRLKLEEALRTHMPVEPEEATEIARMVLYHGAPPGKDEFPVVATLRRSAGATDEFVERVMWIVRSVRDGVRLLEPEPPVSPVLNQDRLLEQVRQPLAPQPPQALAPIPLEPPTAPEPVTEPVETLTAQWLPPQTLQPTITDHEEILAHVIERLQAVKRFHQLTPHVQGAQTNLRTLRIAVSAEADDSVRLPHLLEEWLATRTTWETKNQELQSAQATLRATEWLLPFLRWPPAND